MRLFNKRKLDRSIGPQSISQEKLELARSWAEFIRSGRIESLNEDDLRVEFSNKILQGLLGYVGASSGEDYSVATEKMILGGTRYIDLALGRFSQSIDEIMAPIELKKATISNLDAILPGRHKSPVQQAWEYATGIRGVQWVVVTNGKELRLYGFGEGVADYERFNLENLECADELTKFYAILSRENLLGGFTLDLLKGSKDADREITAELYSTYSECRAALIHEITNGLPNLTLSQSVTVAQRILDRVIFIAFAEDMDLLPRDTLAGAFETRNPYVLHSVWQNFLGLFRAVDEGSGALRVPCFNGGLFARDENIEKLSLSEELCKKFREIGKFDFGSEVSVTILGHIFEQSVSDLEELRERGIGSIANRKPPARRKARSVRGRRKAEGIVYTPDYVARFIVEETLGRHLEEEWRRSLEPHVKDGRFSEEYEEIVWKRKNSELKAWKDYLSVLKSLKIVDPACGSGVFLIAAFDFMKSELARVNEKVAMLEKKGGYVDDLLMSESEILANNLFGVDINFESVEITKLSLWIRTARSGKELDTLSENIVVGDSILEREGSQTHDCGFCWRSAFPSVFENGGFDIVLGNPPYVRQEGLVAQKESLKNRYDCYHGKADLYCYFFEQGIRLLKSGGRLGFISSGTFLKASFGGPLRKFLTDHVQIEDLVDFGDSQVFEGVTTYPIIFTGKRASGDIGDSHVINYWDVSGALAGNFRSEWDTGKLDMHQSRLGSTDWKIGSESKVSLLEKICAGKEKLLDVYGRPFRGIVTGMNDAFIIDSFRKQEICNEDPRSEEVMMPLVTGKDVGKWYTDPLGKWLIFTRHGTKIEKYPAIERHLAKFRRELEPKPEGWQPATPSQKWHGRSSSGHEWYELQSAFNYFELYQDEKIIFPHFNRESKFSFDKSGLFTTDKAYIIPTSDLSLLGLLNSRLYWFLLMSWCPIKQGGFYEFRTQYLRDLPIPSLSDIERDRISDLVGMIIEDAEGRTLAERTVFRRFGDLVGTGKKISPRGKLANWWRMRDFSEILREMEKVAGRKIPVGERSEWEELFDLNRARIFEFSARVREREAEIDEIVFNLFDITKEERRVLAC